MTILRRVLLFCLLASLAASAWGAPPALTLGVMPHLSTPAALARYQPLQLYLQQRLQRPVELHTAADQKTFVENIERGEYGMIIVAPHIARLAQNQAAYLPLAASRSEIVAVVVVEKNNPLQQLAELRGATVTAPERQALVTLLGLDLLRGQQLAAGRDFELVEFPLHISAVLAVAQGRAAAAVTGLKTLNRMPQAVQSQVKVAAQSVPVPEVIYLAHPAAGASASAELARALFDFAQTPAGQQYAEETGYAGLRQLEKNELEKFDGYAKQLKSSLGLTI